MSLRYTIRRVLIAVTWSLALATWGGIAQFLLGVPEIGPALPAAAGALIGAAPLFKVLAVRTARAAAQSATL